MKKITFILLALCVAGAIVAGCGDDEADAEETTNGADNGNGDD